MVEPNDTFHPSLNKFQNFQVILVYFIKCPKYSAESPVAPYSFFCTLLCPLNSFQVALHKSNESEFPKSPKFFSAEFPSRRHSGS